MLQAEGRFRHPSVTLHFVWLQNWKIVRLRLKNHSAEIELPFGTGLFTAFCHERKLKDGLSVLHSITYYMTSIWHADLKDEGSFLKNLGRGSMRGVEASRLMAYGGNECS